MSRPRRDRGGWRRVITLIALLGALASLVVVVAPLDGVSDRIAEAQGLGPEGAGGNETEVDARLVLQLGMLFAALYVAFLCLWISRTRGGDGTPRTTLARVRSRWIVARSRLRSRRRGRSAAAGAPSVCSIAWKRGRHRSRFQAVISTPGDRRRRVLAESAGLRWPPKDARNPPTRELEAALASLVAQIVAAGWEPVQTDGSWTERRFVWRATNLVALDAGEAIAVPVERRRPLNRVPIVVAAVLTAATAIAGIAVARGVESDEGTPAATSDPSTHAIAGAGIHLRLPTGWARAEVPAVTGFGHPVELRSANERVVAVAERLPATSPTLLPLALQRAGPVAGHRPNLVELDPGRHALRYRFASAGDAATVVLAAPTTRGVSTVACRGASGDLASGTCEALASAVTVPGSRPLEPGRSTAFLSRLPATVTELEAARDAGMRALSSASGPRGQIAAAAALARAHHDAAVTLAPVGIAGDPVPERTVSALSATSNAYAALADAVRAGSGQRYVRAGRDIRTGDARLRRALRDAAGAANMASSAPVGRPARPAEKDTNVTVLLLGLLGATAVLFAALAAAREVRHAR